MPAIDHLFAIGWIRKSLWRFWYPFLTRRLRGDAESLPFESETFDAVINGEASRCHPNFPKFLRGVGRDLAGTRGSRIYTALSRGEITSRSYCLTKRDGNRTAG